MPQQVCRLRFRDDVVAADAVLNGTVHVAAQVVHIVMGFPCLLGQLESDADAPVGVSLALVGHKVAEGVNGDAGRVRSCHGVFQRLHDMWMRADDDVCTAFVEQGGDGFLFGVLGGGVFNAPMYHDDDVCC